MYKQTRLKLKRCAFPECHYYNLKAVIQDAYKLTCLTCPKCELETYHSRFCIASDTKRHSKTCGQLNTSKRDSVSKNKAAKKRYIQHDDNVLGGGSYGYVIVADDLKDNSKVALKIIKKSNMKSPELITALLQEIKIHYKLNHPHIIKM